eukprot:CAMPEP_0172585198 /NCGR_PEP_ID=MMETSP1068-20121228/4624_1 /TAXON_ID=35684 /ORGANISM="Pseudopedinella elastica, Strain CCMP716" /LENGTH=322 /DNA_ID=CAMNT_0013379569 /DNA_START=71 /DNA_END=1039 /DNA_ORIENTATION=+
MMNRLVAALLVTSAGALQLTPCTMSAKSSSADRPSRRGWLGQIASGTAAVAGVAGVGWAPSPAGAKLVYFPEKGVEGVAKRVRKLAPLLDDLQRDLADEEWDFIAEYPGEFKSFVPAFTKYTDAAFPDDTEIDKNLRLAMRYEVGKLFKGVERLKQGAAKKDLGECQAAFADISLSFDRYLKSGNLYEGDASTVKGDATSDVPKLRRVSGKAAQPRKQAAAPGGKREQAPRERESAKPRPMVSYTLDEAPVVGDAVVILDGYEQGKTGTLLGVSKDSKTPSGIIKTTEVVRGFREILVVPLDKVAKQTGDDVPIDAALAPKQ